MAITSEEFEFFRNCILDQADQADLAGEQNNKYSTIAHLLAEEVDNEDLYRITNETQLILELKNKSGQWELWDEICKELEFSYCQQYAVNNKDDLNINRERNDNSEVSSYDPKLALLMEKDLEGAYRISSKDEYLKEKESGLTQSDKTKFLHEFQRLVFLLNRVPELSLGTNEPQKKWIQTQLKKFNSKEGVTSTKISREKDVYKTHLSHNGKPHLEGHEERLLEEVYAIARFKHDITRGKCREIEAPSGDLHQYLLGGHDDNTELEKETKAAFEDEIKAASALLHDEVIQYIHHVIVNAASSVVTSSKATNYREATTPLDLIADLKICQVFIKDDKSGEAVTLERLKNSQNIPSNIQDFIEESERRIAIEILKEKHNAQVSGQDVVSISIGASNILRTTINGALHAKVQRGGKDIKSAVKDLETQNKENANLAEGEVEKPYKLKWNAGEGYDNKEFVEGINAMLPDNKEKMTSGGSKAFNELILKHHNSAQLLAKYFEEKPFYASKDENGNYSRVKYDARKAAVAEEKLFDKEQYVVEESTVSDEELTVFSEERSDVYSGLIERVSEGDFDSKSSGFKLVQSLLEELRADRKDLFEELKTQRKDLIEQMSAQRKDLFKFMKGFGTSVTKPLESTEKQPAVNITQNNNAETTKTGLAQDDSRLNALENELREEREKLAALEKNFRESQTSKTTQNSVDETDTDIDNNTIKTPVSDPVKNTEGDDIDDNATVRTEITEDLSDEEKEFDDAGSNNPGDEKNEETKETDDDWWPKATTIDELDRLYSIKDGRGAEKEDKVTYGITSIQGDPEVEDDKRMLRYENGLYLANYGNYDNHRGLHKFYADVAKIDVSQYDYLDSKDNQRHVNAVAVAKIRSAGLRKGDVHKDSKSDLYAIATSTHSSKGERMLSISYIDESEYLDKIEKLTTQIQVRYLHNLYYLKRAEAIATKKLEEIYGPDSDSDDSLLNDKYEELQTFLKEITETRELFEGNEAERNEALGKFDEKDPDNLRNHFDKESEFNYDAIIAQGKDSYKKELTKDEMDASRAFAAKEFHSHIGDILQERMEDRNTYDVIRNGELITLKKGEKPLEADKVKRTPEQKQSGVNESLRAEATLKRMGKFDHFNGKTASCYENLLNAELPADCFKGIPFTKSVVKTEYVSNSLTGSKKTVSNDVVVLQFIPPSRKDTFFVAIPNTPYLVKVIKARSEGNNNADIWIGKGGKEKPRDDFEANDIFISEDTVYSLDENTGKYIAKDPKSSETDTEENLKKLQYQIKKLQIKAVYIDPKNPENDKISTFDGGVVNNNIKSPGISPTETTAINLNEVEQGKGNQNSNPADNLDPIRSNPEDNVDDLDTIRNRNEKNPENKKGFYASMVSKFNNNSKIKPLSQ